MNFCKACGYNKFRTVSKKDKLYACRKCGAANSGSRHHVPPPAPPTANDGFTAITPRDAEIIAIPIKDDNDVRRALMDIDFKRGLTGDDAKFVMVMPGETRIEEIGPKLEPQLVLTAQEKAEAIPVVLEPVSELPPDAQFWEKEAVTDEQFQRMLSCATPAQRAEYEKTGILVVAELEAPVKP